MVIGRIIQKLSFEQLLLRKTYHSNWFQWYFPTKVLQ